MVVLDPSSAVPFGPFVEHPSPDVASGLFVVCARNRKTGENIDVVGAHQEQRGTVASWERHLHWWITIASKPVPGHP